LELKKKAVCVNFVAFYYDEWWVDLRSRMLAFLGVGGEPPRHACGVSPVPQIPQESRTFRSNQHHIVALIEQSFRKKRTGDYLNRLSFFIDIV
jgi:hypothetical protein